MTPDAPQRKHNLRAVFNAVRYVVRTSVQWEYLPNDFPPYEAVYQQARRWLHAKVYETITDDLRIIARVLEDRDEEPSAVILDGRTLRSTCASGHRAGFDGHKKKPGSKVHISVDTLGNLLDVVITQGNEQERDQLGELVAHLQNATEGTVEVAYVNQGSTGTNAANAAAEHNGEQIVVKHAEAKKGFLLLPRRRVVERTFGWLTRHRRPVRDYVRRAHVLAGYHCVAFIGVLSNRRPITASKSHALRSLRRQQMQRQTQRAKKPISKTLEFKGLLDRLLP